MDISKNIISIREKKKIKQLEIAQKLDIEPSNWSRLEKRGDKLTIEQLKQIAGALGVELNELLGIENKVPEMDSAELEYWEKEVAIRDELLKNQRNSIRLAILEKQNLEIIVINAFVKIAFDKALELGIVKNGTNTENFTFLERLSKNDLERLYREKLCNILFMYNAIGMEVIDKAKYFKEFHNDFFEMSSADYWQTPFLGK